MSYKKYLISGLITAAGMFLLSCLWHGVVLNDFIRVPYPMPMFMTILAMLYIVVSFIIQLAYRYLPFPKNYYRKGLMIGFTMGGVVFLASFVLGASYSGSYDPLFAIIDLLWQVFEQSSGALIAAYVIDMAERREQFLSQ